MTGLTTRPVLLTREGSVFRLAFAYRADLVERARSLPYAHFDGDTRTWSAGVFAETLDALNAMFYDGLLDVTPGSLLGPDEAPAPAPPAVLVPGTTRRPFTVRTATRDETLYAKLRSIPGARWETKAGALSYPETASVALAELVGRGLIHDPERLLSPAAVVVAFDARAGRFVVRGDERAAAVFARHFPHRDVMAEWRARGLDVAFDAPFSEEVYRGELARVGPGLQPSGLAVELRPFQAQNVAIAVERSGFGVFDGPGLGKTVTAIATGYELLVNRELVPRILAVVPGSARTQWAEEIVERAGHDDVIVIAGDAKTRAALYRRALDESARWIVVNYDLLSRDFDHLAPLASGSLLVADEAHRLKNPGVQRTKAMRKLAARAARRLALTGTPVENEPGEWYSVLSGFTIPGLFGSPTDFLGRYQYPGRFGGYEGARNLAELRERSRPHYARHLKEQVATHLPPLQVYPVRLDPSPAYATILRRAHAEAREEIRRAALERRTRGRLVEPADTEEIETAAEMTAVGMLKLLCISPRLLARSEAPAARALVEAGVVPDEDGPKLDWLRQRALELRDATERAIVFCFSAEMAALVAERLTEDGVPHVLYTGSTSDRDREAARLAFTTPPTDDDPGPTIMVATDAGSEALNLGRCCSTVINLDVPWKATTYEQRGNRVHRLDGTAPHYQVVNLVLSGTLERGLLALVERKADLQDAIFGEHGGRRRTTGGRGVNVFETALDQWESDPSGTRAGDRTPVRGTAVLSDGSSN